MTETIAKAMAFSIENTLPKILKDEGYEVEVKIRTRDNSKYVEIKGWFLHHALMRHPVAKFDNPQEWYDFKKLGGINWMLNEYKRRDQK